MTTISITVENRGKLLVIRESVLGIGASFNDVIIELHATYAEHQSCAAELEKVQAELTKCKEQQGANY